VSQSEHQRLAGILAYHWGNEEYALPNINREAFLLGVATHDRAFGMLDTLAVGNISELQRVEQVDRWITEPYENPEAELVVLLHVRRLMNSPELHELCEKLDSRIAELVMTHNLNLTAYEQADTITDLCDLIAFDFSFEAEISRTHTIYQDSAINTEITYKLSEGRITIDKWPFNVPKIEGYILGYEQDGYPENLQPVLLNFELDFRKE
jgi:hypothetical protein